ncbi:outer membrane protein assembly factor BamB family protein [Halorientalis salina]|uniref:outer membrane protein assembly factor BamB family protein n=1 Tax=Halorientalis salina TaxID=2932266 RepID=UPI0010AC0ABB|nr:PQQ-binding-like beta-propeller repeat protein [Halorientalis salina]
MRRPALSRRSLLSGLGLGAVGIGVGTLAAAGADGGPSWPQYRYDATGAGYAPDRTAPRDEPTVRWRYEVEHGGFSSPAPICHDGRVFQSFGERLVALDAETGAVAYELTNRDRRFLSTPAVADAAAYVSPALVTAWEQGYQSLGIDGGLDLPATDERAFTSRWHVGEESDDAIGSTITLDSGWQTPPVVVSGTVFATGDGIAALDASSGRVRWHRETSALTRPAVAGGTVYLPSYGGGASLVALDASTGERQWETSLGRGPRIQPVAANGLVYVTRDERLVAVDTESSDIRWRFEAGENERFVTVPVVREDTLFIRSRWSDGEDGYGGRLYALDAASGTEQWAVETEIPGDDEIPPVAAGDTLLLPDQDTLLAHDAETGDELWRFEGTYNVSSPAVGDGTVYLSDADAVYALEGSA